MGFTACTCCKLSLFEFRDFLVHSMEVIMKEESSASMRAIVAPGTTTEISLAFDSPRLSIIIILLL